MKHNPEGKIRVVTGSAGGLWIQVPPKFHSRPTQDRVKQAIFSSLGAAVDQARVLDLFSGSGSLGIEALSRGAASATFVEESRHCTQTISENLVHCSLHGTVVTLPVEKFLAQAPSLPLATLVLADPPYVKGDLVLPKQTWFGLLARHVSPAALVVLEHHFKNSWQEASSWELLKQSRYGETTVTLLRRREN